MQGRPVRDRQRINKMNIWQKIEAQMMPKLFLFFIDKLRSRGKREYVSKIYKNKIDFRNGFQI